MFYSRFSLIVMSLDDEFSSEGSPRQTGEACEMRNEIITAPASTEILLYHHNGLRQPPKALEAVELFRLFVDRLSKTSRSAGWKCKHLGISGLKYMSEHGLKWVEGQQGGRLSARECSTKPLKAQVERRESRACRLKTNKQSGFESLL